MNIKIKYNGEYPNLCVEDLNVIIDDKEWKFPSFCLLSGGRVSFTEDWDEIIEEGE